MAVGAQLSESSRAARAETDPGLTGILPLVDGRVALGSRLFMVARAEVSIEAQYCIRHDDISGLLLLKALIVDGAAELRNGVPDRQPDARS